MFDFDKITGISLKFLDGTENVGTEEALKDASEK
jgi:hypothetical protein